MNKINFNKLSLIKALSAISFVSLLVFVIMIFLLILNFMGVEVYTRKFWEYYGHGLLSNVYYVSEDNMSVKTGIIVGIILSIILIVLTWVIALVMVFKFFGKDFFKSSTSNWIMYFFPLSIFSLMLANRKAQKRFEKFYEAPSDFVRDLKDKLIYGNITPEEFEKEYTELLHKSKIEK